MLNSNFSINNEINLNKYKKETDHRKIIQTILLDNNLRYFNYFKYSNKNIYKLLSIVLFFTESYSELICKKLLSINNWHKYAFDAKINDDLIKNPKNKKNVYQIFKLFGKIFNKNIIVMKIDEMKFIIKSKFFGFRKNKEITILEEFNKFKFLLNNIQFNNYIYFNTIFNKNLNIPNKNTLDYFKNNNIYKNEKNTKLIEALNQNKDSVLKLNLNKNISIDYLQKINFNKKYNKKKNNNRYLNKFTGWLKFYDENKKYGFIINDDNKKEIFLHYDDLIKLNDYLNILELIKKNNKIKFQFELYFYNGKYKNSSKAVNLELIEIKIIN